MLRHRFVDHHVCSKIIREFSGFFLILQESETIVIYIDLSQYFKIHLILKYIFERKMLPK